MISGKSLQAERKAASRGRRIVQQRRPFENKEQEEAFRSALIEAEIAALRLVAQIDCNISHLQAARLEVEAARDLLASSNRAAANRLTDDKG